jgi:UDP-N-acetylmuramyl pentapeptide phosphotransferase/UDP-N-acetylglucosamine-1-phosphate transferase
MALQLAFVVSAVLCWRFAVPDSLFHVLDHPGERSLHHQPTPRSGGVAIVIALLLGWGAAAGLGSLAWDDVMSWLSAGVVVLAIVGAIDDRMGLSPLMRLMVQMLAAFFLLAAGLVPQQLQLPALTLSLPCYLMLPLTVLYVLWMTNLYNFMDGMDGFAGGMAVMGFAAMAWLGWQGGNTDFMLTALIVASACVGFLVFNFPPARIFMGDAGAPVLGFLAAALSLWADRDNLFPLWVAVLIFSPFIVDASYTLLKRILAGKKVWQAHREHIYQQLVQMGWSHRRTVLWSYVLMLAVSLTAVMALNGHSAVQWAVMVLWILIYSAIIVWVSLREKQI